MAPPLVQLARPDLYETQMDIANLVQMDVTSVHTTTTVTLSVPQLDAHPAIFMPKLVFASHVRRVVIATRVSSVHRASPAMSVLATLAAVIR
jgi:predicted naringenin-chalcone synthase